MKGLVLDYSTHRYFVDGQEKAGVGRILTGLGIVDRSHFTEWATARGSAVHSAIEYHLTGGLDWESIEERLKPFLDAALLFLSDAKVKPGPGTYVELPIWHPLHQYAGTPDLVCEAFGEPAVPDFKTGGLWCAGLASAFYEKAARIAYPTEGDRPRRRMAVQLLETGRYKKTDLADGMDYPRAMAAADLFNTYIFPRQKKGAESAFLVA